MNAARLLSNGARKMTAASWKRNRLWKLPPMNRKAGYARAALPMQLNSWSDLRPRRSDSSPYAGSNPKSAIVAAPHAAGGKCDTPPESGAAAFLAGRHLPGTPGPVVVTAAEIRCVASRTSPSHLCD